MGHALLMVYVWFHGCKPVVVPEDYKVRGGDRPYCEVSGRVIQPGHILHGEHADGKKWCGYVPPICVTQFTATSTKLKEGKL